MSQTQVQSGFIGDNSITAAQIATDAVTTAKIANGNVTTSKLDSIVSASLVPIGGIIMWSGSVATIPSSWALCNGSNGTPNLQDKFLVGAGNGYAVGATGGSANATLPSHNHTIDVFSSTSSTNIDQGAPDANIAFVGSSVPFGQTATVTRTLETTGLRGVSATNANLPPYYALAFIMRVS